ncbi:deoxycytidyl transferase [Pichia kluyveri]|uniref:DNA repair protein REV1 n=1 Tax=Pichia kluyveri TaxID=36015 RepID=A0AAV5RCA7_PICKL|nr:deoxycytidyl transferase [Pichia kluyveri]
MDDRKDSTETNTTWDSLDDDAVLSFINKLDSHNQIKKNNVKKEVLTDIDTDVDTENDDEPELNDKPQEGQSNDDMLYASIRSSQWSSMNDSKFINYVNKLTQSKQFDTTIEVENTSYNDVQLLSSPILPGQRKIEIETSDNNNDDDDNENDENDENEELPYDQYDNYEDYFAEKNRKQNLQGEELSKFLKANDDSGNDYPPIFKNCAIHVNGRTDPDILQLRKLILLYGGKYVHYLSSKRSVTHIVAENLPPRKRIQFGNCKVVSPKWIMDSIEAKRLLDYSLYRIEKLNDYGQQIIKFPKRDIVEENGEIVDDNIDDIDNDQLSQELSQELQNTGIDATHPNFLKVFFSKSRLHHLSSWKSELRSNFINEAILALQSKKIPQNSPQRIIMHVDFDCFFATVSAMKHNPPIDINTVPCCVTHGGKSADIASCNYIARQFGVSNGMWLSNAKELCPNIVSLPYYFEEYETISKKFYQKLLSMDINTILPVSIDEALVDISYLCSQGDQNVEKIVKGIKEGLDSVTKCTLSCGAGRNVLLAKLALRKAKPNGVYYISDNNDQIDEFLKTVDVKQLPGFGKKLYQKLNTFYPNKEEITVSDLKKIDKSSLINTFGAKMGAKLYDYARGIDDVSIDILKDTDKYTRKSVNIDVNWGVRFSTDPDVETFLSRLANELSERLLNIKMIGTSITLKLSIRHTDAPIEPTKYMGMGRCEFTSKTAKLGVATRDSGVLGSELKYLWRFMNVEPKELRGVGVSMNKLTQDDYNIDNKQMKLNFTSNVNLKPPITNKSPSPESYHSPVKTSRSRTGSPVKDDPEEQIDWDVFNSLPPDLQLEIKNELRRRKLQSSPKKRKLYANDKDIANLLSPKKKKLTMELEKEQYLSPHKIKEQKQKNIVFQGIPVTDESILLKKLVAWMDYTLIDNNELNENDLELFRDFMIQILSSSDTLRFLRIYQTLKRRILISPIQESKQFNKWNEELESLKQLIGEQPLSDFQFKF